jgi:hypothetical protein
MTKQFDLVVIGTGAELLPPLPDVGQPAGRSPLSIRGLSEARVHCEVETQRRCW